MRNKKINGETPIVALPDSVVTSAINAGAMKAVARPDNPYRPKLWVARSGSVWRTIIVRLAD